MAKSPPGVVSFSLEGLDLGRGHVMVNDTESMPTASIEIQADGKPVMVWLITPLAAKGVIKFLQEFVDETDIGD